MTREMLEEMEESQEAREKGEPGAQTENTQRVRQRVCREKPSIPVVVRVSLLSSTGYNLDKINWTFTMAMECGIDCL